MKLDKRVLIAIATTTQALGLSTAFAMDDYSTLAVPYKGFHCESSSTDKNHGTLKEALELVREDETFDYDGHTFHRFQLVHTPPYYSMRYHGAPDVPKPRTLLNHLQCLEISPQNHLLMNCADYPDGGRIDGEITKSRTVYAFPQPTEMVTENLVVHVTQPAGNGQYRKFDRTMNTFFCKETQ